jgi:urease accessory protein
MCRPRAAVQSPTITAMTTLTIMIPLTILITTIMIMGLPTPTTTSMDTLAGVDRGAPLPLLIWLSPAFPVGAYAYSHGLEWAVEAGDIVDARSLQGWLLDLLEFGAPRSDAILFAGAFRAAAATDWAALMEINALTVALTGSAERRLETTAQGAAFVAAARAAWDCEPLRRLESARDGHIAYPVAVAAAASGHAQPLDMSLAAFVLAQAANLVSAALRLGSIGQTDGQKILAALLPRIQDLAHEAQTTGLAGLGSCAFRSDIAAMRHETQYSRLFRS